jgi:hypothetical protein
MPSRVSGMCKECHSTVLLPSSDCPSNRLSLIFYLLKDRLALCFLHLLTHDSCSSSPTFEPKKTLLPLLGIFSLLLPSLGQLLPSIYVFSSGMTFSQVPCWVSHPPLCRAFQDSEKLEKELLFSVVPRHQL